MVSNNVFISANHLHPVVGSTVTFHLSNDPAGTSLSRTVTGGQRIGTSDLWLGVLGEPLTDAIAPIPFLTEAIANAQSFNGSSLRNAEAYLVGRSAGSYPGLTDVAVGQNIIDLAFNSVTAGGTTDFAIATAYGTGTNDLPYEALLASGDSGAPLLVMTEDGLSIAGINWFVGEVTSDSGTYPISGFSYVGNYHQEITDFIDLHAIAIPEPGFAALLIGLAALGWRMRQRRV